MAFLQPLTTNLTLNSAPVTPLADLSRREGSTDAYNYAKLNIPTAMRRRAGAWRKWAVRSSMVWRDTT